MQECQAEGLTVRTMFGVWMVEFGRRVDALRKGLPLARRVLRILRRSVAEPAYRLRVLRALDEHVVDRASVVEVAETDRLDREWLRNESVFLIGGCEFTYVRERLEAFGTSVYHTFDHGRSGDPELETGDLESPLRNVRTNIVLLSTIARTSPIFHRLLWEGKNYELEHQRSDVDELVESIRRSLANIRDFSDAPVLILGHPLANRPGMGVTESNVLGTTMSQGQLRHLIAYRLYEVVQSSPDVYYIDVDTIAGDHGRSAMLNSATELLGEHFTRFGGQVVAEYIIALLHALSSHSRKIKVAVVDLDNTLWSGVLREDGIENVRVRHHRARALKLLARRGILLAVCSKNDPEEARLLAELLGKDLVDSMVAVSLSWEPKSIQLQKMARELDLGLESFALFDDSPRERSEVEMNAPEVLVLSDDEIISALSRPEFQIGSDLTEAATKRAIQYRERQHRRTHERLVGNGSRESYLESLDLVATIGVAGRADLPRVAELLARTNQLNATLARSSIRQLGDDDIVIVSALRDRFGDHGIVGATVVRVDSDSAEITEFAFSCRAMGFNVEHATLLEIRRLFSQRGIEQLVLRFVPTQRNARMREILQECGFREVGHSRDGVELRLDILEDPPTSSLAPWIDVIRHD